MNTSHSTTTQQQPANIRDWFDRYLAHYADDIASHGADAGYPRITYTADCVAIFDAYDAEIWDMVVEEAYGCGYDSVMAMIAGFNRVDMAEEIETFKALMVWYACEKIAREIVDEQSEAGNE